MKPLRVLVCSFVIVAVALATLVACEPSASSDDASSMTYLERLRDFETTLLDPGPSPQRWSDEPLPANTREVRYPSGDLSLRAWVYVPTDVEPDGRPALVYFHGGFAFNALDLEACQPFIDQGFVVMCPMLRGENGNPGHFEMMLGEVEDAKAAVQWLATQPYVDETQIYAFGHSVGGGIASLLALRADVPIQHSGGCGGLYNTDIFSAWSDRAPFDASNTRECELRTLIGNTKDLQYPHYAYLGTEDGFGVEKQMAEQQIEGTASRLTVIDVPGDHMTSLRPAMLKYLEIINEGGG